MPRTLGIFPTLFCGTSCDTRELQELKRLASKVFFRAGQTIFSEGNPADYVFGLSQGLVRLYKLLPDGRRQVVAFPMPGDFLGIPLISRYGCSADAVSESALCRFPRDALGRFIRSSPNLMQRLIDFAVRELDRAQEQLMLLGNASAEERVAAFLVSWRDRSADLTDFSKPVPLPMRRQDIADYLGLNLETLSRVLGRLERKNAIRLVPKGVVLTGVENTLATGKGFPAVEGF